MNKALANYNFFDPEVIECPFDFYQAAREEAPVYRLPDTDIFFVSRHEDTAHTRSTASSSLSVVAEQSVFPEACRWHGTVHGPNC